MKILHSPTESKIQLLRSTTGIGFGEDSSQDQIQRTVWRAYFLKMPHKAKLYPSGSRKNPIKRLLPPNKCRRMFQRNSSTNDQKEEMFCKDDSTAGQLSEGSTETLRTLENCARYQHRISPRSAFRKFNYEVECGAKKKYIEYKETPDGSIFRITVSCILVEILGNNRNLFKSLVAMQQTLQSPPLFQLFSNQQQLLMVGPSLVIRDSLFMESNLYRKNL